MSNVITVASQKGGVGKTTTALNLAYSLSRLGERTLVVDLDPQGSLATAANLRKRTSRGVLDLVRGRAPLDDVVVATRDGTMAMASLGAARAEDALEVEDLARSGRLAELLRELAAPYAATVIDAPSGVGGLVTGVLAASDSVVVPMQPRLLSLRTLSSFLRAVQHVRHHHAGLRIAGVVVTMFDGDSIPDVRALEEMKAALPEDVLFRTVVPRDDLFEEATARSVPVAMVSGGQRLAGVFIQLALELRERNLMWETPDHGETADLF